MKGAKESGFALVSTIVIFTVLIGISTALSSLATQDLRMAKFYQERQQAFYAAESGLNLALVEARRLYRAHPESFFEVAPELLTIPRTQLSDSPEAYYQVTASRLGDQIYIVSEGEMATASGNRAVTLQFVIGGTTAPADPLFAAGLIDLSDAEWQDNYTVVEHHLPSWAEFEDEIETLDPIRRLFAPGVTGEHTFFVTGLVVQEPWHIEAPDSGLCIYIDGGLVVQNRIYISGTGPVKIVVNGSLTISGSNSIIMDNAADVDIYVLDSMAMSGSAAVRKTPASSSSTWGVFHVGGSLTLSGNVRIGAEDPLASDANIVFLMDTRREDGVVINGSKVMEAGIYAPTRFVTFNGNQKLFDGSLVARLIVMNKGNFQFDEHLTEFRQGASGGTGGGEVSVFIVEGSWREK